MAPEIDPHIDDEEAEAYSMGRTSEPECARLEEHLLLCQACRKRVADNDVTVASMRLAARCVRMAEPHASRVRRARTVSRTVPVIVAVGLLSSLAFLFGPPARQAPHRPPAVAVDLAATRGIAAAQAPAGHPLDLRCDLTDLPAYSSYRLEVVNATGQRVWQAEGGAVARVDALPAGAYFVRVYSPGGELLREYGLAVGGR